MLLVDQMDAHIGAKQILHAIDFSVRAGSVLGLVGPNGSGKSTLIRCITGLLAPTCGSVRIGAHNIQVHPLAARLCLGFAPDPNLLPPGLTARQVLRLSAIARTNRGDADVPEVSYQQAERLALSRYLDSYISTLSLGTKQKLAVLIALMHSPPLLILDEIFNGLDPKSAYVLKQILRELAASGCAIVLATHGLELAADLLSEMLLLSDGRVAAHWQAPAFAELRTEGAAGLERAIVQALESDAS
jgi:ABC-2 type transport system ATP-binding protein